MLSETVSLVHNAKALKEEEGCGNEQCDVDERTGEGYGHRKIEETATDDEESPEEECIKKVLHNHKVFILYK